jgi:hypothetical protein
MKIFKKGLLGRSLFDFYGDIKAQTLRTKESSSVPNTPVDGDGGVMYTKSADGKLYYKSNEVSEVELSASDAVLTTEEVQDIAGPLVATGGTKTGITVTYDDDNNNMDFVVDDLHNVGVDGSANNLLTDDGDGTVTSESNFTYDGSDATLTKSGTAGPYLFLKNTNANNSSTGVVEFVKDSSSPANNDYLGGFTFKGNDDGGNITGFAQIFAQSANVANGSESGLLTFLSDSIDFRNNANTVVGNLDSSGNLQIDGGLTTGSTSVINSSGVIQVATQGTIDHDSLANFVAAEHYRWDTDISSTATINAANIPTLNQNTTGSSASCTGNAATATALASGDQTINGDLTVDGVLKSTTRRFTVTSDTDGTHDGDVVFIGGTTSMTTGAIYHYKSDGTWELADATDNTKSDGLLGVALGATSDTNGVLLRGMVTLDHDPGAVGDVLYLKTTAGDSSSTAPSSNGNIVRVIGYCLNASNGQIWFNPDSTFVEITA